MRLELVNNILVSAVKNMCIDLWQWQWQWLTDHLQSGLHKYV